MWTSRSPRPLVSKLAALVTSAAFLMLAAFLAAADGPLAPKPDDRAISTGRWAVAAVEWDGKPVDTEFLALLRVSYRADGSWAVQFKSVTVAEGTSTNRQDDVPKTFDMTTLGSPSIAPTRYHGIYRLDGDIRMLCIAPSGAARPDEFKAPKRSGRMLVTLKRLPTP